MAFVVTQPTASAGPPSKATGFKVVSYPAKTNPVADFLDSFTGGGARAFLDLGDKAADPTKSMVGDKRIRTPQSIVGTVLSPTNLMHYGQMAANALTGNKEPGYQDYKPKTTAGRYGEAIGSMLPNALMGPVGAGEGLLKNALARTASVVVPGVTSQGAADVTKAAGGNDLAQGVGRAVGAVSGGVASTTRIGPKVAGEAGDAAVNALARKGRIDTTQMRAKADEMRQAGVEPTLTDVAGERGRRVIRAVGVKSPDAGETLTTRAQTTSANTKPAVMARTRKLAGADPRTADQFAADLEKARDTAAKTEYAPGYAQTLTLPEELRAPLSDAPGKAIIARARADATELQDAAQLADLDALATMKPGDPMPDVSAKTLDRLVIAARERGKTFAKSGRNSRAAGAFARQSQLDAPLNDLGAVQPARANFRAKSQGIDVINKPGARKDVFSTDPADYKTWLDSLSPEARQANAIATRQDVLDTLGGQRASALGSIDELATSEYARANLTHALGDEAAPYLKNLTARLEQTRNASFVDPKSGSRTAVLENDLAAGAMKAIEVGKMVGHATHGSPGWITPAIRMLQAHGISEVHAKRIAELAVDPKQLDAVISYLEQTKGARTAEAFRKLAPAASAGALSVQQSRQSP